MARANMLDIACAAMLLLFPSIAAATAQRDADPAQQVRELLALSDLQNNTNHAQAILTAQKALDLSLNSNNLEGVARAYSQIGRCFMAQSDLPQATQNYDESLRRWQELNNTTGQAEVLIMLGYIADRQSEWSEAISRFMQAQGLTSENDSPLMGQIAAGLADAFNESGMPEVGLVQYQRALDSYRKASDTRATGRMIWALGATYYLLKDYPQALSYLQQANAGFDPSSLDAAQCNDYLGRVYVATHENGRALQHLRTALTIYRNAGNPREIGFVLGFMGQAYEQEGEFDLARTSYERSVQTLNADRMNEAAIYYALGKLEMQQNDLPQAEIYLRQSIAITEDVRRIPTSNDLMVAFSASVHDRYRSYIECLMRRHKANPSNRLSDQELETSELSRGRALAELLRTTQTDLVPGLEPGLATREKILRQSLRVRSDNEVRLLGTRYRKEELDAAEKESAALESEYKSIREKISSRYPAYDQITRPVAWNLQQIQQQVIADDQTLLLEYSLGEKTSYVWAVTSTTCATYELPGEATIGSAVSRVYESVKEPPSVASAQLSDAAHVLTDLVLSPVANELRQHRRLIVVADASLNYVPFQVLPQPGSEEPLIAAHEIVNAPSATILGELQREASRRPLPTNVLAAFGDPAFVANYNHTTNIKNDHIATANSLEDYRWQAALRDIEPTADLNDHLELRPLFYAREELANLRAIAGDRSFIASGFAASRANLQATNLSSYAVLHFATHGILDPKRPDKSGLVLSTFTPDGKRLNGFVGLNDIYGLRAPVDLVVLSACRTGLGKDFQGEGLIGLTRGFMYAGASSVVASLWKVDDEATAELMKRFYSNLLERKMPPAAALREAQNSLRRDPEWSAPYYWAAFTLQGDYRNPIRVNPSAESLHNLEIILAALAIMFPWLIFSHRRMKARL